MTVTSDHKVKGNTITAKLPSGRRIKVTYKRNVGGDWYATKVRVGRFRNQTVSMFGPVLDRVLRELHREFEKGRVA